MPTGHRVHPSRQTASPIEGGELRDDEGEDLLGGRLCRLGIGEHAGAQPKDIVLDVPNDGLERCSVTSLGGFDDRCDGSRFHASLETAAGAGVTADLKNSL
jgi:hypothetical protein